MNQYQIVNAVHNTKSRAGFPRTVSVVAVVNQLGHVFGFWDGPDAQRKAAEHVNALSPDADAPAFGGHIVDGRLVM